MAHRSGSVEQKNTSVLNPLFRYNVPIGDKLQPIISLNPSKWDQEDKIEEEPKITFSIYGSGGKNQELFVKCLFPKLEIIHGVQFDFEPGKNKIHARFATKGSLLLFLYSELYRKTHKNKYKNLVQCFIKGFFHYHSNITIIFIDNTKNTEDTYHVDWFKHYLYDDSSDQEYFVVHCLNENNFEQEINKKQFDKRPILNISSETQTSKKMDGKSYFYKEKNFPNINYFFFVPKDNDIQHVINFNSSMFDFFRSKIITSQQYSKKKDNPKEKKRTFVNMFTNYLSFFFTQVVKGKRFITENNSVKFEAKTMHGGSIHIDPKDISFKDNKNINFSSIDLINFDPKFKNEPKYYYEKVDDKLILTLNIAAASIKQSVSKNIIKITDMKWKVLKSQDDVAQQKKGFFQTHTQEVPELLIQIPKELGTLQKKGKLLSNEKGFLKFEFPFEKEDSDSD
jgi:hypothetical protein